MLERSGKNETENFDQTVKHTVLPTLKRLMNSAMPSLSPVRYFDMMIRLLVEPSYVECLQMSSRLERISVDDEEQQISGVLRQNNTFGAILVVRGLLTQAHHEQACYSTWQ